MLKHRLCRFLESLVPPRRGPITLQEALPWLVPKVRPRFVYEALRLRTGRPGPEFRPLAGSFAMSLVVDLPDAELDVGEAELARWDTDFDRLLQKARSNLLARGGEEEFQKLGPGRYRSTWQDNLDGSRVLLPGLLQRLSLRGDPVVVLPNRDTLLVVGSEDPQGLRWALEGALEFLDEDPRSLNGCPLRLRNYQWEPFRPLDEHPIQPLLGRVHKRRLKEEYGHQKALLDRRHDAQGKVITLAPFHVEKGPTGQVKSFTEWSPAMGEAWLPEADQVRLAWVLGRERGRAWVPWAKVQSSLNQLMEPVGLFPERHRFKAVPQPSQLEELLSA
ncbi:MAG: hypothetical protein P4L36_08575 [Holophaga sp.]|nr:hypothetical protein [Holophaga sp.]